MKRIVNLVDDYRPGGIRSLLDDMANAIDEKQFDWSTEIVNSALPLRVRGDADTIVVHSSSAWRKLPWLMLLRASKPGARLILVEHHYTRSFEAHHVGNVRRFRRLLRTTYRLFDAVVAVSEAQANWLVEAGIGSAEKIKVIDSCRDYSRFLRIPRSEKHSKQVVIGAMGRLVKVKGFDVLISAMQYLPADRFLLRIAGDGEEAIALRNAAAAMPNVEFTGHLDDPAGFLAGCDLFVVPSRMEAFGLVCAEAKAAGLPVVVSNVDALPKQAEGCGVVVEPDDARALAKGIRKAACPEQMHRYRVRGRQSVAHAWSSYLREWNTLLVQA